MPHQERLEISASRTAWSKNKDGETVCFEQKLYFSPWHSPSVVDTIVASARPHNAYIDFLGSMIYEVAEGDWNSVADHLCEFNQWYEEVERDGYIVQFRKI